MDWLTKDWYDNEVSTKMFLSTGLSPVPAGIMLGTTVELGDFDGCVKINNQQDGVVGQYCIATLNIPRSKLFSPTNISEVLSSQPKWKSKMIQKWYDFDNHFKLARGFCSPSECNSQDLQIILQNVFPLLDSFDLNVESCQTMESRPHDSRIWIPATIILVSIVFVIFGTFYSKFVNKQKDSKLDSIVRSFDAIENTQKMFDLSPSTNASNKQWLDCFDGMRVIFSFIVVLMHLMMSGQIMEMTIIQTSHYPYVLQERVTEFSSQIFSQPYFLMVIFFTMSSILMAYTGLKKNSVKESFIVYSTRRWARYIPSLIGTICIFCIIELIGDGPLYHHDNLKSQTSHCYNHWWRYLLLVQNFYGVEENVSFC